MTKPRTASESEVLRAWSAPSAGQMGHRSSDIVHNHYKALVLKSEAEKFWNLKPKAPEAAENPVAKKTPSSPAPSP